MPVFVAKDDAREAQSAESDVYGGGGAESSRGMAAQMQVGYPNCFDAVS